MEEELGRQPLCAERSGCLHELSIAESVVRIANRQADGRRVTKVQMKVGYLRTELLRRNGIFESFFEAEAPRLAEACHEMSRRFLAGGRLLAFGNGSASTDAQHVSVEFVHPVIVGKRALPALDLGPDFESRLPVLLRSEDIVMGFAFPEADELVERAL